jgi:hypothetical protein
MMQTFADFSLKAITLGISDSRLRAVDAGMTRSAGYGEMMQDISKHPA